MGIFSSFSSKEVDAFARELAGEVFHLRAPAKDSPANNPGLSLKNFELKMNVLLEKAHTFQKTHKLGIYKRARLANTFRWELKERGYTDAFIEACTQKLVIAVSKKE